jgi:hypothetical protein
VHAVDGSSSIPNNNNPVAVASLGTVVIPHQPRLNSHISASVPQGDGSSASESLDAQLVLPVGNTAVVEELMRVIVTPTVHTCRGGTVAGKIMFITIIRVAAAITDTY